MRIQAEDVVLRDMLEADVEDYVRWFTEETEWSAFDAPWAPLHAEAGKVRADWTAYWQENCRLAEGDLRRRFEMEWEGRHIGWVCAYPIDENGEWLTEKDLREGREARTAVGISIAQSGIWGRSLGSKALRAFCGYLFERGAEAVYTQTWSGNARMIRCAEKLGFAEYRRCVGQKEVEGQRFDWLTFQLKRPV